MKKNELTTTITETINQTEKVYIDEFNEIVDELLKHDDVLSLDNFKQHLNTSRLQHSINVAYYSYLVCKKFNWDYKSATRAGLLHDLFLYDWREERQPEGAHAFAHPKVALRNAKNITELNKIEEDAIVNHMWPLTISIPKFKESMVVSFADKYSACIEVACFFKSKFNRKVKYS